ncbi:nitrilase-related carbon-nitrogen hydrolase [Prosthecobacter sp.]|uniref:nitrilase-related carbon-nitrogen hydrolase n=1 Tax=Prosthecobacter sp. TaxID=1965333 RepID=UPI00248A0ADE|nr:nitrilase-related carbon-nitrogen hydrolase [Prosthecobacter sp.]MDI1310780.1 helix-turn-helix domain-containing protein [Prosthecobacter sp.]
MKSFTALLFLLATAAPAAFPDGWSLWSPRDEAKPDAEVSQTGGHGGKGSLILKTGAGEQWIGCWTRTLPIEGGQHYQFSAWKKASAMPTARRSVYARILWQDENGKPVQWEEPAKQGYAKGTVPRAEPEYPPVHEGEANQWTHCESTLRAPVKARQAKIELYLQWAANARVEWSDVSLGAVAAPAPRKVRLATIHLQPKDGKNPTDKPPQYAPLIAAAAQQKADLVVLGETLTYYGTGKTMAECAESVPGPSTEYFGKLAKEHHLYIVAGLVEREGKTLYNTAALMGPDGALVGKYRKVTLHPILPFCFFTIKVNTEAFKSFILRKKGVTQQPKSLGEHLRKQRLVLGLRQEDVANELGTLREVYDRWERDERLPVVSEWPAIISFLGYYPAPEAAASEVVLKTRRCHGMTQKSLAKVIGVIHQRVRRWERGQELPPSDAKALLMRLATLPQCRFAKGAHFRAHAG